LAVVEEGEAWAEVRNVIVIRDFERMPEKGFTVLPTPELLLVKVRDRTMAPVLRPFCSWKKAALTSLTPLPQ